MGLVVSPHAEGPGPLTQGKSRRGGRSFKKGAGAAKGNPSPAHNNYDHGEGPRLGGRGPWVPEGATMQADEFREPADSADSSERPQPRRAGPGWWRRCRAAGSGTSGYRPGSGPQTPPGPPPLASTVSRLLSGWGAGINLSPPSSVQSQARSHAGAGRVERGGAEGAVRTPVGFSKPLCAVAAGRARAAGEQGAAQSPQAPAGGVAAEARRSAAQAASGPGEWSNLTAGTRRRRAGGNGGGGGGAGRQREAWAVTRAPERGPMVLEGPRRPVLQVRRDSAEPLCVRGGERPRLAPRLPGLRGPRGRPARGLRWRDSRGQMARPRLVPGDAACGPDVHAAGLCASPTPAPILIRCFPGTLCGRPGTGRGRGRGRLAPGVERVLAGRSRPAESGGLTGPVTHTTVVRSQPPRLGSILGSLLGGGGRVGPPGWTPSRGREERKPGRLRWQESARLRGAPGEDCSCLLAGDQIWVPRDGWPRPSLSPSSPVFLCQHAWTLQRRLS